MAQLSTCHSWDSQDGEKSCLFIFSIYWYKDCSLRDISKCDIWSQVASVWKFKWPWKQRPMACLLLGLLHKRDKYTWSVLKFQWEETCALRHAPENTSGFLKKVQACGRRKFSNMRFPHDHPVNYWTELFLLIRALVCTQWVSYLSNSPLHTHTWLQASSCMFLKVEQMGLSTAPRFISCCFEMCSLDGFF